LLALVLERAICARRLGAHPSSQTIQVLAGLETGTGRSSNTPGSRNLYRIIKGYTQERPESGVYSLAIVREFYLALAQFPRYYDLMAVLFEV
jgi:hypothetical protein